MRQNETILGDCRGQYQVEIRPVAMFDAPEACQVWLKVGPQEFPVGNAHEKRAEAKWYAGALLRAMRKATGEDA